MELQLEELSDNQLLQEFDGHQCKYGRCDICYEYMRRFDEERLKEVAMEDVYYGE